MVFTLLVCSGVDQDLHRFEAIPVGNPVLVSTGLLLRAGT
jgi:hypothetical protein